MPQRDGIEAALPEGKNEEELTKMVFELDEKNITNNKGRKPSPASLIH